MSVCILCLDESHSSYYNICDICNNSKICHNCYHNNNNTHQLKQCPICRQRLSYYRINRFYHNIISLKHYSHIFYYIFFNILLPNIVFSLYFPNNVNKNFITHKVPFLICCNYINIVIVPIILYYYYESTALFKLYCSLNVIFFISLNTTTTNEERLVLYYIYNIAYIYICSLFHFLILSCLYFIIIFNKYRKKVLTLNPMFRLKYNEIVYN